MSKNKSGLLIVIEGIDGSGKSIQSQLLYQELLSRGIPAELLFEPTEGKYGKLIRKKLKNASLTPEEAFKLFVLDRKENVMKNILPALKAGKVIIMDRYYTSTIAYQGASGIPIQKILKEHQFAPEPDLVFIIDIPVSEAFKRLSKKNSDAFEKNFDFLERVRKMYLDLHKYINSKVIILDGRKELSQLHNEILKYTLEFIAKKHESLEGE
ncbi:MAG: dTMP kinase [Candidatus Njordarchaeia archaeon]|nr:dTMP kinase [Candidatus Korarchaeota archaeon]